MAKIHVKICCGIHCSVHGGQELLDIFETEPILQQNCICEYVKCLNCCEDGQLSPILEIDGQIFTRMTPERFLDYIVSMLETH